MAFAAAPGKKTRGPQPAMNVTPLVDVVLVLLIIFMVITPLLTKQFWLHVPIKDDQEQPAPPPNDLPVVLTVRASGGAELNHQPIDDEQLATRLPRVFAGTGKHTLFFEAEDGVPFGRAMEVLDLARAGGAVTIAVLTDPPR